MRPATGENITIAVIAPVDPEDFFDLLWQGVWEATFDLSSFGVEVQDLTTRGCDLGAQREILETLLNGSVDGIALMPAHSTALNDLIEHHDRNGVPVVAFYADAPASLRAAFVGPDPYQAGELAGEVLAKLTGGRGRILSFPGSSDQFHLEQRYQGFRKSLEHYGSRIEESAYNPEAGGLSALGQVAGFYIGTPEFAPIAEWIEHAGIRAPCVGFTNSDRVRPLLQSGTISAVIDENRYQLGYFAVQKAYEAVLKRKSHERLDGVQIPSTVVFAANATAGEDSLHNAFELLVRQRTEILLSYKQRLEEANAQLLSLAVSDPLTGLFNRRKFQEVLEHELNMARRYGPVSLLMIDLNDFKSVNDRYGHAAGDEALKAVACALSSCCRITDTCSRLGGDEFAVILPRADCTAAEVVRDRIQRQIALTTVPVESGELNLSLSIGIASMPEHANDASGLMAAADAAMYRVKQASRSSRASRPPAVCP